MPCVAKMTAGAAQTEVVNLPAAACDFRSSVRVAESRSRSAPGMPPGQAIASQSWPLHSSMLQSATTLRPRDMRTCSEGMTEATITSAPARTRVSVMHAVSISSESSATGTSTRRTAASVMKAPLPRAKAPAAASEGTRGATPSERLRTSVVCASRSAVVRRRSIDSQSIIAKL